MSIVLITEHGGPSGSGTTIAAWRLHQALRSAGADSILACRRRATDDPTVIDLPRGGRVENLLGRASWRIGLNDVHCLGTFRLPRLDLFREADVIHLHGLHTNWFNYLALPRLARRAPLVATIHDMWWFTGHCASSLGCERWMTGCGRCPHPTVYPPIGRDATALEWRLKRWVHRRAAITFIAPSAAYAAMARRSMIGDCAVHHIPHGVDTGVYRPLDRQRCRERLRLPADRGIVLFAAQGILSDYKGAPLLAQAVAQLPGAVRDSMTLLLMGDGGDRFTAGLSIDTRVLGYVRDDAAKVDLYNAADVLALPSAAENQSLTLLEAMACCTPAVAFDVGGNSELVRPGETGFLAPPGDIGEFARGLAELLVNDVFRRRAGDECRRWIERYHAMTDWAARHIALYRGLAAAHPTASRRLAALRMATR
jgi:glycosyltransferase involved in cell wall biosynthesis